MIKKRPHSKEIVIPQKLLDEETRLEGLGLKIKETTFNQDESNKLSQAIITLISPYNNMGGTYSAYYALIAIACTAWNASLVDEPQRDEMVKQIVSFFKDKTDAKGLLEFKQFSYELIERKLLLFPNDRRLVSKFDVTETKENYHVFVISLDKS